VKQRQLRLGGERKNGKWKKEEKRFVVKVLSRIGPLSLDAHMDVTLSDLA
jgi:hypothetical protein